MVHIKKKKHAKRLVLWDVPGEPSNTLYTPPLVAESLSKIKVMQAMESEPKVIAGA